MKIRQQNINLFLSTFLLLALTLNSNAQKINSEMESKIDSILKLLTLKEKVDLCHAQSKFSSKGVSRLGIPELWMADGPHGVRAEISWDSWNYAGWTNDSITAFPALTCLAATFSPDLAGEYGLNLGEEARYREKDVLLGPGVNIYRTPLNGRNFEYMGEDPYLASMMAVPYIKGVQKNGVAACVKHYALNNQEKWRSLVNVELSDRALYEIYLPAFKASVEEAGVWSIMGAYNKVRGQYATHNEFLNNKILKTDWDFDGVVISDWSAAHSTEESALYGLDIEMGTGTDGLGSNVKNHYDYYYLANPFLEAVKNGDIPESALDDKARRVLRLMYRTSLNIDKPLGSVNTKAHIEVANKVAIEGIVLLKNEDQFFPIEDRSDLTIAVIGENATRSMTAGGGSSELKPKFEISPLEGIKKRFSKATILHTMGYESGPSEYNRVVPGKLNADSLKLKAIEVAKKADIVLFVGGLNKSHSQDCEGDDRKQFNLPFNQDDLINDIHEVNPNLGLVLVSGNAIEMPWLDKVKGIVESWYLGSLAGHAIADIISGDINPSGKLPFTFPKKLENNSAHYFGETSYPGVNLNQVYKDDILVGYRWHDTKNIEPLFEFGFGLSYSKFKFSKVNANKKEYGESDTIKLSCTVNNIGDMDGSEVVQVYIGKPKSDVFRAKKELKGFTKTHIKKGEGKTVNINIPVSSLAFYDESISNWNIEKGDYVIYVGNSSKNISKKIKINVK